MQSADSSLIQLQARVADLEKKLGEVKTSAAE
ncbi:Inner membrane protein yiaW [Citrobacter youngae]|nr:Inner membrane protein yiaW [Citrobacter youngae]